MSRVVQMRKARRKPSKRSGQVLVVLSLSLLVLVGFLALVIEIGRLLTAKHELGEATESAALAAAMRLPNQTTGRAAAQQAAALNGADAATVVYPTARSVQVTCTRSQRSLLGGLFGLERSSLQSKLSLEQTDPLSAVTSGLRPLAVRRAAYSLEHSMRLRLTVLPSRGRLPGNALFALSLGGAGARTYVRNLEGGYGQTVRVGDALATESTSMRRANLRGIIRDARTRTALFQQAARQPYSDTGRRYRHPDYPYGDPRIVLLVVGETVGGRKVRVQGFAAFYIRLLSSDGRTLTGRFLEYSTCAGVATDSSQPDFGLRGYRFAE